MRRTMLACMVAIAIVAPRVASAQGAGPPNPADAARRGEQKQGASESRRYRSFEAPAYKTVIKGERLLREEERIGDYWQPRWTAKRRFPTTRVYVRPKGTVQFEYWLIPRLDLTGDGPAYIRSQYEIEFGLGHRLQVDVYLVTRQKGIHEDLQVLREEFEVRWALADWDVIPGNPAIFLEYVRQDGPPKLEGKLLLGGELARRWHWGANLFFEREFTGKDKEHEYGATFGVSATVVDEVFSLGGELKVEFADKAGRRFMGDEVAFVIGPSMQWRPVPALHFDLALLFGAKWKKQDDGTRKAIPWGMPMLVAGWEF